MTLFTQKIENNGLNITGHLNNGPFNDWTTLNHLNTGLVRYSDPHCFYNLS